jgi:hypothetical protein
MKSPSPPRWRFVNEAKKSSGYRSSDAGIVVTGLSAHELASQYTPPPDYDLPALRKIESREVGKLDKNELESIYSQRGVSGISLGMAEESYKQNESDLTILVNANECRVKTESTSNDAEYIEEMEVKEIRTQPTESSTEDNQEDIFVDIPLEPHHEGSEEKDTIKHAGGSINSKQRGAVVLVIMCVLVVMATSVGVAFGKKDPDLAKEESTETSISGGLMFMNNTVPPSLQPSMSRFDVSGTPIIFAI